MAHVAGCRIRTDVERVVALKHTDIVAIKRGHVGVASLAVPILLATAITPAASASQDRVPLVVASDLTPVWNRVVPIRGTFYGPSVRLCEGPKGALLMPPLPSLMRGHLSAFHVGPRSWGTPSSAQVWAMVYPMRSERQARVKMRVISHRLDRCLTHSRRPIDQRGVLIDRQQVAHIGGVYGGVGRSVTDTAVVKRTRHFNKREVTHTAVRQIRSTVTVVTYHRLRSGDSRPFGGTPRGISAANYLSMLIASRLSQVERS